MYDLKIFYVVSKEVTFFTKTNYTNNVHFEL